MVRGVPPFPYVRESLEKLAEYADIVIVSATATEALMREWSEHGLLPLVSAICGQEVGSKAQCIEKVKQSYEAVSYTHLVTDQLVLHVGYDIDNLKNEEPGVGYQGETKIDRYGRKLPKPAHGTENLGESTASSRLLREHAMALYDRIVDKKLLIRRLRCV